MTATRELRLLIVEDDPHIRVLLEAAAERTGKFAQVVLAHDGQDAWDRIHEWLQHASNRLPDFILSDLSMPRMDGIRLIRELKRHERTKHIPIAVMTSSDRPNDRENATAAGCCAFFNKPVRLEEMTALVGSVPNICGAGALVSSANA